jgi:cytochrome c oxidase subunit 3
MSQHAHSYHLVDSSPWPLFTGCGALTLTTGGVMYMHSYSGGGFILFFGVIMLGYTVINWWRDVIREGTYEGHHTPVVQLGFRYGIYLFILSEVMFFFGFFWAFFGASLGATVDIGASWPPMGIEVLDPFEVPFLNTTILLLSGASVTWCHHALVARARSQTIMAGAITVLLGIFFTALQVFEYADAGFNISDGIYGTTFYMATGFHGFHVLIGTIFLTVALFREINYQFTNNHIFGYEAAAWYWHFVDVVWLFLFGAIYWWGGITY